MAKKKKRENSLDTGSTTTAATLTGRLGSTGAAAAALRCCFTSVAAIISCTTEATPSFRTGAEFSFCRDEVVVVVVVRTLVDPVEAPNDAFVPIPVPARASATSLRWRSSRGSAFGETMSGFRADLYERLKVSTRSKKYGRERKHTEANPRLDSQAEAPAAPRSPSPSPRSSTPSSTPPQQAGGP